MEKKPYKVINGNMLEVLPTLDENSFDSCITDPPYELNFMGKSWDRSGIAFQKETWEQVYRVLKPGAYLLAFGGSRTFHRIACAIEDAGFEIKDTIMWLYGSGFPKSFNLGLAIDKKNGVDSKVIGSQKVQDLKEVGKITGHKMTFHQEGTENCSRKEVPILEANNEWNGWGTQLKPAYEPIIVARKPCDGSITDNVLKWGVGGINIDECRVGEFGGVKKVNIEENSASKNCGFGCNGELEDLGKGRFPSNVILTYSDEDFDEVCGNMPDTTSRIATRSQQSQENCNLRKGLTQNDFGNKGSCASRYEDDGNACRYFYCAKATKKDRDEGLDIFETKEISDGCKRSNPETSNKFGSGERYGKNIHPTVKPVELMQYLVRLITPKGGVILDCFAGSGSTGKATMFENRERNANYEIVLVELTEDYVPIIEARCDYALNKYEYDEIKEREETGQLNLFDFTWED